MAGDRLAIFDVFARYANAYSEGDVESFAALFAEDGVLEGRWSNVRAFEVRGRDAIRGWIRDVSRLMTVAKLARVWFSIPMVDGNREKVTATSFLSNQSLLGDTLATGVLKLTLRGAKGRWQIAHAQALIDGTREESAARESLTVARGKRRGRSQ